MRESVELLGLDFVTPEWRHRSPLKDTDWAHQRDGGQLWWDVYVLHCASLADARLSLPLLKNEGKAHRLLLLVDDAGPWLDDSPLPVALSGRLSSRVFGLKSGQTAVEIQHEKWVPVHAALLAAIGSIRGNDIVLSLGGLRVGITAASQAVWTVGDPLATLMTDRLLAPDHDDIYSVDVIIGEPALEAVPGRADPLVVALSPDILPPVATELITPRGYLPYASKGALELTPMLAQGIPTLTESRLSQLRDHRHVHIDGSLVSASSYELARFMSELAIAGVPMLAESLDAHIEALLGPRVFGRILAFQADDDASHRESKSIDMRRAAHETFGPLGRWNQILESNGKVGIREESVSVILATRRPDKIAFALAQLACQSWVNLEVVLVLHGIDRSSAEVLEAVDRYPGQVVVRAADQEMIFGEVLNLGVKASSGDIVTKMDDDDWYGEHHIRDLVHAKRYSKAELVGTQVEFVYLESLDITTRRPPSGERFSDHVAGGTMMISKEDLRAVGNWRPVHRAVDRCLLQAVQNSGGSIYRGHGQNYLMHRRSGSITTSDHTWNPGDGIFLQNVAEQWDGFVPPPQMTMHSKRSEIPTRNAELRSYFSRDI